MIVYFAVAFFITIFGVIIYFIVTRNSAEEEIVDREHHHHMHRGYCSIDPKPTERYYEFFPEDRPTERESDL